MLVELTDNRAIKGAFKEDKAVAEKFKVFVPLFIAEEVREFSMLDPVFVGD